MSSKRREQFQGWVNPERRIIGVGEEPRRFFELMQSDLLIPSFIAGDYKDNRDAYQDLSQAKQALARMLFPQLTAEVFESEPVE